MLSIYWPSTASITERPVQRFVVGDPVPHVDDPEFVEGVADVDLGDAGVDDQALAHGATRGVFDIFAGVDFFADQIHCAADHLLPGGADNRVGLGVDAAAELVTFAAGDLHF